MTEGVADRGPTVDLSLRLGRASRRVLELANPVMPASGCFGPELMRVSPVHDLGAAVTKTVFAERREGNRASRVSEIAAGMVNSVGIPSGGAAEYLRTGHPPYLALGIPVIVSVGGHRPGDYAPLVEALGEAGAAFELNLSCPNLDRDGVPIGALPMELTRTVESVRDITDRPLVIKLPSMVTSIAECAAAAEAAGADALCVANSLPALPIDGVTALPALGNLIGGLSGPNIRPVILRLVWLASRAVSIPVIGCGGVATTSDALEYFAAGASAVQVGTATFRAPETMSTIARELRQLCTDEGVSTITELGTVARTARALGGAA